jgi:RNase P protein component
LNSKTRKQRETNYILEKNFDAIRIGLSKKKKKKKRSHERFNIRGNAHQDAEKGREVIKVPGKE